MITKFDKKEFLKISAEIGKNILFVQGSGGNTSFKDENKLLIKASGFELKDANIKNIFVEVDYKKILEGINLKKVDPLINTWDNSNNLRPSIETSLHAIFPYKYVIHIHCINSLSWLVQKNFRNKIAQKFKDEEISIITYFTPGLNLTMAIQKKYSEKIKKILFLGNHGIVVADDNLKLIIKKLENISNKLSQNPYKIKQPNLSYLKNCAILSLNFIIIENISK